MGEKVLKKIFPALGTVNTIAIYGDHDAGIAERVKERILDLHRRCSVFDPDSEISRINRQAGIGPVPVQQDIFFLLSSALAYSRETYGAFDVTAGALTRLWRKCIHSAQLPSEQEIFQCRRLVGAAGSKLEETDHTVFLCQEGQQIDLGGIAKGYAADEAGRILQGSDVQSALIDLGGTVIPIGRAQRIGIQDPFQKTGRSMGSIVLQDKAIVTSGHYERCFFSGGRRYHHIIDPRTGWPSRSGLASVTLIGDSAMGLDALATAVCVLGEREGLPLLERHGVEAVFITDDGVVRITPGIQGKFSMDGQV